MDFCRFARQRGRLETAVGVADQFGGRVVVVDAVEALRFVGRVATEIVAALPVVVGRTRLAGPAPEVAAGQQSAFGFRADDPVEQVGICLLYTSDAADE